MKKVRYISTIRPKLEHANTVWRPIPVKPIKMIETVQKRCTKFGILSDLSYEKQSYSLNLTRLDVRRVRGDLFQMFTWSSQYKYNPFTFTIIQILEGSSH